MSITNRSNILAKLKKNNMLAKGNGNTSLIRTAQTPNTMLELAAKKFIEVLQKEIKSSGLSPDAVNAIINLTHASVERLTNGTYAIRVYFKDDLSRPSLDVARYGEIRDLALLLNNGVDHTMPQVHGTWKGEEWWSRTTIPGTHFMEHAIQTFMTNYAKKYHIIDIIKRNN